MEVRTTRYCSAGSEPQAGETDIFTLKCLFLPRPPLYLDFRIGASKLGDDPVSDADGSRGWRCRLNEGGRGVSETRLAAWPATLVGNSIGMLSCLGISICKLTDKTIVSSP